MTEIHTPDSPRVTWCPKVGDKIKLKAFDLYGARGLNAWTHLEVVSLGGAFCTCKTTSSLKEEIVDIPFDDIEKPIYWSERYEVTADDEQKAMKVAEWLDTRGGVAVWGSQDLGSAGRLMFTPGDRLQQKPH